MTFRCLAIDVPLALVLPENSSFIEFLMSARWWFQSVFIFTPKIGERAHFSKGLKATNYCSCAMFCAVPVVEKVSVTPLPPLKRRFQRGFAFFFPPVFLQKNAAYFDPSDVKSSKVPGSKWTDRLRRVSKTPQQFDQGPKPRSICFGST